MKRFHRSSRPFRSFILSLCPLALLVACLMLLPAPSDAKRHRIMRPKAHTRLDPAKTPGPSPGHAVGGSHTPEKKQKQPPQPARISSHPPASGLSPVPDAGRQPGRREEPGLRGRPSPRPSLNPNLMPMPGDKPALNPGQWPLQPAPKKKLPRPVVFKRGKGPRPRPGKWGPRNPAVSRRSGLEESHKGGPQQKSAGTQIPFANLPKVGLATAPDVSSEVSQGDAADVSSDVSVGDAADVSSDGSQGDAGDVSSDVSQADGGDVRNYASRSSIASAISDDDDSSTGYDVSSSDGSDDEDSEVWPNEETAKADEEEAIAEWFDALKDKRDPSAAAAALERLSDIEVAISQHRYGTKPSPVLASRDSDDSAHPDRETLAEAASTGVGSQQRQETANADIIDALSGNADVTPDSASEDGLAAETSEVEDIDEEDSDNTQDLIAGSKVGLAESTAEPAFRDDSGVLESNADVADGPPGATQEEPLQAGPVAGTEQLPFDARELQAEPEGSAAGMASIPPGALSGSHRSTGTAAAPGALIRALALSDELDSKPDPDDDGLWPAPAPVLDLGPLPDPVPFPSPAASPVDAPSPSPAGDGPAPAPLSGGPAPAPLLNGPVPAPATLPDGPAPVPAPLLDGPSPAPAPDQPLPAPAPAPIGDSPSPAPALDAPVPAPEPVGRTPGPNPVAPAAEQLLE